VLLKSFEHFREAVIINPPLVNFTLGCEVLETADDIDPAYGKALRRVVKAGVEILAYDVKIDLKRIRIRKQIPIVL
jgi:sugar fermentation stimulation protein A